MKLVVNTIKSAASYDTALWEYQKCNLSTISILLQRIQDSV